MKVLITGFTGFVGRALLVKSSARFDSVVGTTRQNIGELEEEFPENVKVVQAPPFDHSEWGEILSGTDVVVHCAARVHQVRDQAKDPLAEFRRINRDGTASLARYAAEAGVMRFVFISTIKVNGEKTLSGFPFTSGDFPNPTSPYGISKLEGEVALKAIAEEFGMEWVIIRPPLVYGAAAKGNLALLEKMAQIGVPFPLGGMENRRSLVSLDHLVEIICTAVERPQVKNSVLLACDREPVSTVQIYRRVCQNAGKQARVITLPGFMRGWLMWVLKKMGLYEKLLGSLEIDSEDLYRKLGWKTGSEK
ncbi:NAD-dependent epimerase/dehydratase family protein [Hahella ganghwensis]|uniref:NAD-dependent epimerase/dehydratase family protein n=1 Tax=Hahella ganghwensis TaxID=286420 RepID=UPI00037474A1|nr:NAD-dependent epimerase/dehydratase family protein [Hahella ganghwensis]